MAGASSDGAVLVSDRGCIVRRVNLLRINLLRVNVLTFTLAGMEDR